jgi:hypothetical protein
MPALENEAKRTMMEHRAMGLQPHMHRYYYNPGEWKSQKPCYNVPESTMGTLNG